MSSDRHHMTKTCESSCKQVNKEHLSYYSFIPFAYFAISTLLHYFLYSNHLKSLILPTCPLHVFFHWIGIQEVQGVSHCLLVAVLATICSTPNP